MQDTILDHPDRPFPGSLAPTIPAIRALYRQAKILAWDPESAIPWAEFDGSMYTDEQLWAARVYWSGRGWSEYGAIAESPTLQLRYDLDQLEPDLSLYWALRTEEEARHAEVSARFADLLGGYIPEPPELDGDKAASQAPTGAAESEVPASVPHLGTRARALAPDVPVEATIAGLVCVAETVAYDVFLELVKAARDPVAKWIYRLIARDETRHCRFGWEYLAHRGPNMSVETRRACAETMYTMVQDLELGGYRSAWLAPDRSPGLVDIERTVFEAGLGGTTAEWEGPIVVRSIRGLRDRGRALGIELPTFHHDVLGEI